MDVHIVPCLGDNFAYLIVDRASAQAAAVDPVEPLKVLKMATALNVTIAAVLTTHSHMDHAGGNVQMTSLVPTVVVYGGRGDNVAGVMVEVDADSVISLGSTQITTIETPCHTPGHVSYLASSTAAPTDEPASVFTGDTLFVAGCGNFNNGTPEQMYTALVTRLCTLPPSTRVFCGHEYTVKNLRFALTVEPGNAAVARKLQWAEAHTMAGGHTVPSTIADELATNPFVRLGEPAVHAYTGRTEAVAVLAEVRRRKTEWGRVN